MIAATALVATAAAITVALVGGTTEVAGTSSVNATASYSTGGVLLLYATGSLDRTLLPGSGCEGTNGYDDITEGAPVTLYDQSGTIVAAGALGAGTVTSTGCMFTFTIPDIPFTADFFQYEITHRGKLTASKQELLDSSLSASLGTP